MLSLYLCDVIFLNRYCPIQDMPIMQIRAHGTIVCNISLDSTKLVMPTQAELTQKTKQ